MKSRNLENLTLCITSIFLSASAATVKSQDTTILPDSTEDFAKRTYRPILHSEDASKTTNISALKHLARIAENKDEEEEKVARAGCPVGNPDANVLTSGIPFVIFIAAFAIGVFWVVIFFILYERFSDNQFNRSYDGESLGNLIKNVASDYIHTSDFNKMSELIINSISKLY